MASKTAKWTPAQEREFWILAAALAADPTARKLAAFDDLASALHRAGLLTTPEFIQAQTFIGTAQVSLRRAA